MLFIAILTVMELLCGHVLLESSTGDLCLCAVFWPWAEEKLSMVASRKGSILDAIVVNLSLAVFPLKGDTVIR